MTVSSKFPYLLTPCWLFGRHHTAEASPLHSQAPCSASPLRPIGDRFPSPTIPVPFRVPSCSVAVPLRAPFCNDPVPVPSILVQLALSDILRVAVPPAAQRTDRMRHSVRIRPIHCRLSPELAVFLKRSSCEVHTPGCLRGDFLRKKVGSQTVKSSKKLWGKCVICHDVVVV